MKTIPLNINVSNFIDSYRSIGYTIETAIADIIDNSIYAKATRIDINMEWDDYSNGSPYVQIIDNGIGMTDAELTESMRLACKSPADYRDPTDLGRFGLGLKTASFSQCQLLTVGSKKEDNTPCCKQWDVSFIKKSNEFLLFDCSLEESGLKDLIPSSHGTVVTWDRMDNLNIPPESSKEKKEQYWRQVKKGVYNHISQIFGSFKGQIEFYFNGNTIKLWDPFLKSNPSTTVLTEEEISFSNNRKIKVSTFIIPSALTPEELEIIPDTCCINDLQGFYVYRNNRLIISGSWLGLKGLTKKEAYRLARIRLDIDNTMDDLWHIDIKKEVAICPPELQDKLIAYAKQARVASSKVFRVRKKYLMTQFKLDEKTAYLWKSGLKDSKPFFEINRKNPTIESFIDNLPNDLKKDFLSILKYLETYIPVMAIMETESTSRDGYIQNAASEIDENELISSFDKTVAQEVERFGDYQKAIEFVIFSEPFFSSFETIKRYLNDRGEEV